MNLQTREDLFNYFDALQKKHANNGNSQKQTTNRNIPKKSNVIPEAIRPKKILLLETMPKVSRHQQSKSGYDPAKVKAERTKRGQQLRFSGAGPSKVITPKERDRYDPEWVKTLREKRKEANSSTNNVQKEVKNTVFSRIISKMSSGYNPSKVKELREKRNGDRGKGLIDDFDKYMSK